MMNGRVGLWWAWLLALALILGLAMAGLAFTPSGALADEDVARLMKTGRWREARAELERVTAASPNDAKALSQLALVLDEYDETKRALELAEKAAELDPKSAECRYAVAAVVGGQAQKASVLKQLGLAKRFKREAEATAALDPKHVDARFALMVFHCKAPGIAGGDRKSARVMADQIAAIDPVQGWMARARLAQETKDTTAIEGFYRKAMEAGGSYEARMALAGWVATTQRKGWDEGEKLALEARESDPGRSGAHSALAQIYAVQKRTADVEAALDRARRDVPWTRLPEYQAARVTLLEGGDLARAEQWMREYLTVEPEPGTPTHAHARWRLGLILEKQGRKQEAIAEVQSALKMKPDLDEAKKDLKRMKA
jgi:tetratricopeptide (TPR) repeat protein